MLRQRARGRRHSEQTKLKIRHTTRLVRGSARVNKVRKQPVPFQLDERVVETINEDIQQQVDQTFRKEDDKYTVTGKRVMSPEAKEKLSRRIKQMWGDPTYRSKVSSGVEARQKRLELEKEMESMHNQNDGEAKDEDNGAVDNVEDEGTVAGSPSARSKLTRKRTRSSKRKEGPPASPEQTMYESLVRSALEETEIERGGLLTPLATDEDEKERKRGKTKREILLSSSMLHGWTKEDLGIVGSHGEGMIPGFEGIVSDGSSFPSEQPEYPAMSSTGLDVNGYDADVAGTVFENTFSNPFLSRDSNPVAGDAFAGPDFVGNVEGTGLATSDAADGGLLGMKDEERELGLMEVTGQDIFPDARNMGSPFGGVGADGGDAVARSPFGQDSGQEGSDLPIENGSSDHASGDNGRRDAYDDAFTSLGDL